MKKNKKIIFFLLFLIIIFILISFYLLIFKYNPNLKKIKQPIVEMTKERIGKITWKFLHSTILNINCKSNNELSEKQIKDILTLINLIPELFPCKDCSNHFKELLKNNIPSKEILSDKLKLSIWFCKLHNIVNKRLKKKEFKCNLENLNKYYLINKP
jgi:hypothetical protein